MATLNTLRTRGGIIVSVVIGIALLAFLLGDLNSAQGMFNASKMRVGEINGNKVGYMEYVDRVDYYTNIVQYMTNSNALSTEQQDEVRNIAWEEMVNDYVFQPGFEKLGITVSETEQIDMVDGTYVSPVISSAFMNPQTGAYDPSSIRTLISQIDYDARSAAVWNYMKAQMTNQRLISKYMSLMSKGMFVTDLETKQGVDNANTISDISYVVKNYTSVPDSTVTVTASEIKAYYDSHRKMFKQAASRDVEYVLFSVLPSEQDYADAEKAVNDLALEFEGSDNPMQFAALNSQSQPSRLYLREDQLTPEVAAYAFGDKTNEIFGPALNVNTYTMARVADTRMMPDSLQARHILLSPLNVGKADSIVNALKKGGDFAALANEFSIDMAANAQGGDLGMFAPEQMIPEFSDAVVKANTGEIVTVTTPAGMHIVQVTYKSPLVKKVQLADIVYRIEPSTITQQDIYGKASAFVAAGIGSYDNFKKAASDEGLTPRAVRIRNTDQTVSGMENSRELIRWAFNAEAGTVSSIMEIDEDYVVAALTGVAEDGIVPLKTASPDIENVLRMEKKGEMISGEMTGSSLADIASKLGLTEPAEAKGIEFNSFYIDGLGVEPKLIGAVSVAAQGSLSKPVTGVAGVYVFDTVSRETVDNATAESEKIRIDATNQSYIGERINQAVYETSDIKDMRVKFF